MTKLELGACPREGETDFTVWAPYHLALSVVIEGKGTFPLQRGEDGYFTGTVEAVLPGDCYLYQMENGRRLPDPVSRSLPKNVTGPTEIIDPAAFEWQDEKWRGIPLNRCIFYEVHVGTFTPAGTFEALIEKLPYLREMGINCIELMPVAEFSGRWNWGYDGASLYAPFSGYGGPDGLKRLVNACHQRGIAVCLDVVYNHLGPEGSVLVEFGPYLSETYHTPWGKGLNYDGPDSDHVRRYIIENALYWIAEYHIDVLRLDAIHGIYDFTASQMLPELIEVVKRNHPQAHIVAESDLNDAHAIKTMGLDALWNDDYHHAAHVSLTGERGGYYQDFVGLSDVKKAISQGFVYDGVYSQFRRRRHGNSSKGLPLDRFIVFTQNHDQVGNRPFGDRLNLSPARAKVAAVLTLLTPSIPLLFMGQEYGERAPFDYFVDYHDEHLMQTIYQGRRKEFARDEMPFPGKEAFLRSKLTWKIEPSVAKFYKELIAFRLAHLPKGEGVHVYGEVENEWVAWEYQAEGGEWIGVFCYLGKERKTIAFPFKEVEATAPYFSTEPAQVNEGSLEFALETALVYS